MKYLNSKLEYDTPVVKQEELDPISPFSIGGVDVGRDTVIASVLGGDIYIYPIWTLPENPDNHNIDAYIISYPTTYTPKVSDLKIAQCNTEKFTYLVLDSYESDGTIFPDGSSIEEVINWPVEGGNGVAINDSSVTLSYVYASPLGHPTDYYAKLTLKGYVPER